MPVEVAAGRFAGSLAERLRAPRAAGEVVLHWLGQAGFVLTAATTRVLVDPYLSDTLAEKYRGTATPHERMMAAPITVGDLDPLDLVLCTHHHTDHMDPGTLAPLAALHPELRFVVPRASRAEAMRRAGVGADRLVPLDAGERVEALPGLAVEAVRAAHETLERDADGCHRFLGYALSFGLADATPVTVLHAGDTIPFAGQVEELARLRPDLMLLPVNGRSAALAARGVPGNLTLDEAVGLTAAVGTPVLLAHHYGMFAFNTLDPAAVEAKASEPDLPVRLVPAREGLEVRLRVT